MMYRGDDGEMREYQIVETQEHESIFQKACPILPVGIAIICAILNLCPGECRKPKTATFSMFYVN